MQEILTPAEMAEVDRLAIADGPFDARALMRRAGAAVAAEILRRYPGARRACVLCGPGNNGGDGYVIADILGQSGMPIAVFSEGVSPPGSNAAFFASALGAAARPLASFEPVAGDIVVDALYGAGLARDVSADVARAAMLSANARCPVVAVDLPSGVSGQSGGVLGAAFHADLTVTFVRRKPGHLLLPGREYCGEMIVADIGITDATVAAVGVRCFENSPAAWLWSLPSTEIDAHKYSRGHVAVVSGGASASGAARLAANAAARIGAGAVTLLSPLDAIAENAAHLTSIMLKRADTLDDLHDFIARRHPSALVFGPGLAPSALTASKLLHLVADGAQRPALVIDAGALTALAADPQALFAITAAQPNLALVLTPHDGEFAKVFPDLAGDAALSKLERARLAAARAGAVVILKGSDTVIASSDGRAAINLNGTPLLATAGSGDVLCGIIAGLLAQGMPPFEAACASVWIHAQAARSFGPGLIADDLPLALLPVLRDLLQQHVKLAPAAGRQTNQWHRGLS